MFIRNENCNYYCNKDAYVSLHFHYLIYLSNEVTQVENRSIIQFYTKFLFYSVLQNGAQLLYTLKMNVMKELIRHVMSYEFRG